MVCGGEFSKEVLVVLHETREPGGCIVLQVSKQEVSQLRRRPSTDQEIGRPVQCKHTDVWTKKTTPGCPVSKTLPYLWSDWTFWDEHRIRSLWILPEHWLEWHYPCCFQAGADDLCLGKPDQDQRIPGLSLSFQISDGWSISYICEFVKKFTLFQVMTTTTLIANIGGMLGLCMGFSFVSLVEVVYFSSLSLLSLIDVYWQKFINGSRQ